MAFVGLGLALLRHPFTVRRGVVRRNRLFGRSFGPAAMLTLSFAVGIATAGDQLLPRPVVIVETFADAGALADSDIRYHGEDTACEGCDEVSSLAIAEASALQYRLVPPAFLIDSDAAFVLDESCDVSLFDKNRHRALPPASLTKMMTALVAVERVENLDQRFAADVSGSRMRARGSSVMGIEPGIEFSMRELLHGLMLPSGNDAALAIANIVAGSERAFVELMNAKAAEIGLENSHFANPHGLDHPELYSTAEDLVLMGRAVMANPVLAEISHAPSFTAHTGLAMVNGNKMLGSYPGAFGVKIGYTRRAAHTITVGSEREGRRIYAAVLGSEIPYIDAARLLDWAFSTPRPC